jgi:type II secretory pathway pseudopilin PulG
MRRAFRRLAAEEGGFTLIELLVTIGAGIIVIGALFAIQNITLFETGRVFARVDATQQARLTMERIGSRLHSSCIADGITPIQPTSTGTTLRVISKYGGGATLTPELHVISLAGTTLQDATYAKTGGISPNWTFSSTASSTVNLVSNVSQSGSTPLFTYYAYGVARDSGGNAYLDTAGNPYVMLLDGTSTLPSGVTTSTGGSVAANTIPANSPTALSTSGTGLSATTARTAAAVKVTMVVNEQGTVNTQYNEASTFSNTFSLRLTPPLSDRNPQAVTPCG